MRRRAGRQCSGSSNVVEPVRDRIVTCSICLDERALESSAGSAVLAERRGACHCAHGQGSPRRERRVHARRGPIVVVGGPVPRPPCLVVRSRSPRLAANVRANCTVLDRRAPACGEDRPCAWVGQVGRPHRRTAGRGRPVVRFSSPTITARRDGRGILRETQPTRSHRAVWPRPTPAASYWLARGRGCTPDEPVVDVARPLKHSLQIAQGHDCPTGSRSARWMRSPALSPLRRGSGSSARSRARLPRRSSPGPKIACGGQTSSRLRPARARRSPRSSTGSTG